MAYTAWSVVYGEQPTAAKWNQLGANDAGFRDGTNFALNNNVIPANALATNALHLGTVTRTSAFSSTVANLQIPDLSLTVTIPAGGRTVLLLLSTPTAYNNTIGQFADLTIWKGTVGSGTRIGRAVSKMAAATTDNPSMTFAIDTPAAGSVTYNAGLGNNGGGTANIGAGADWPARLTAIVI